MNQEKRVLIDGRETEVCCDIFRVFIRNVNSTLRKSVARAKPEGHNTLDQIVMISSWVRDQMCTLLLRD